MEPITVLITGAAGQIGYSLIYMVAKGDVFGQNQKLILKLLDIPPMMSVLNGVVMEIQDCAFPILEKVVATDNEQEAFTDVDAALLVGAMPRREGMLRKDLLAANVKIFKSQGTALDKFAKRNVKVVVVGNPANTNCFICAKYAPSIPRENFSAMTRLDQNRACTQVALKLDLPITNVMNAIIWGNHSSTQFPDLRHATVTLRDGSKKAAIEAIKDDNWVKNTFVPAVQQRGAAVIAARKLSSAMSAAKAIGDHMHDWWHSTAEGVYASMAVSSDGSYDIPEGIIYGFPVKINKDRTYNIVKGLAIDDYARKMMDATLKELQEERDLALTTCQD